MYKRVLLVGLALVVVLLPALADEVRSCDNGDPKFDPLVALPELPPLFPTDSVFWSFRESIPVGLTRTAGVVDPDGWIRVICGNTMLSDTSYKYQQLFDPANNAWFEDMAISHPGGGVHNHDVEIIGDTIYVGWGSLKSGYYDNLTMIDLVGYTWSVVGPAPQSQLLYYEFAVCNRMLYCFGGAPAGGTPIATARKFDPSTKTWTTIASMPAARRDPAAAVVGDTIYLFGGFSSGTTATNTCYAYNTVANTWRTLAPMPQATGWATAHVIMHPDSGAFIYVCGGENSGTATNAVQRYRVASNTWVTETPMQQVKRSHAGAVIGNCSLYVITGYSGARPFLRKVELGVPLGWVALEAGAPRSDLRGRLEVWPNPCRSVCLVRGLSSGEKVELYDVRGRRVAVSGYKLNLVALQPGVYVARTAGRAARFVKD